MGEGINLKDQLRRNVDYFDAKCRGEFDIEVCDFLENFVDARTVPTWALANVSTERFASR